MQRIVIFDSGDTGRRLWEALAARPTWSMSSASSTPTSGVRGGRSSAYLSTRPRLRGRDRDHIAVAASASHEWRFPLAAAGVGSRRIIECPTDDGDAFLTEIVADMFPDPLAGALASAPASRGLRIGIFGTGAAGMKVWEVLAQMDVADAVWFADNNPQQHGRAILGLEVIPPAEIGVHPFDAIVIGSMSRDPIREQLVRLGIPARQVLTPDVAGSVDHLHQQLTAALATLADHEVAV